jgi:2'-5' RNA ligase
MTSTSPPCAERTLRNERRDFPEWHRGRTHYALWALKPASAALDQRVQAAQAHLAEWLLDGYRRQSHITLGLCGFLSAAATQNDDFDAAKLQDQLTALRQLRPAPFAIDIGALDSFSSVPYLAVQAETAALHALHQCLAGNATINTPTERFTPHVTVGLYGGVWPLPLLREAFGRLPPQSPLRLDFSGIQLLSYTAREIGGPLQRLADYDFASGNLQWNQDAEGLPVAFLGIA